jgi:UDP-glucose 4-epimerase
VNVLVAGGAGYIGSHAVKALREAGHHVVVLDNFSHGYRAAVPSDVHCVTLDLAETERVAAVLVEESIDCVLHFAAFACVSESVGAPLRYYANNTAGTLSLLLAMEQTGVSKLVFSSTCATYGEPQSSPINEELVQSPVNPYGWSKLFSERMIRDAATANPKLSYAILRYFNVAGCALDGSLGEWHNPETHLIPVVLQAALGQRAMVVIHGDDYPTFDGTCIRDYIHVEDLVRAHIAVMTALLPGDGRIYNLGIGNGYSVRQIVDTARRVSGRSFPIEVGPRRAGDPPVLFADPAKIRQELAWAPEHTEIEAIVESAWRWFRDNPHGYRRARLRPERASGVLRRAAERFGLDQRPWKKTK